MTLARVAAAEAIGTALLLAIVVGSGIMAHRLAQGNAAVALLANAIATGAGLYTLIVIFGPVSGVTSIRFFSAARVQLSVETVLRLVLSIFPGYRAVHLDFISS